MSGVTVEPSGCCGGRGYHLECKVTMSSTPRGTQRLEQKESLGMWIPRNICKKECVYFLRRPEPSDTGKMVCVCGHTAEQHLQEAMHPPGPLAQKWDPKIHTQERPTDAFGDMVCSDLSEKQSKYVRLSDNTPPGTIYELMTQHWGLREPNLLISVTGGAKDFTMKPRLRSVFRRGLVKVAQTTGAWVITGGTHTGVMKEVGQAVRDSSLSSRCRESRVVTVGVATWGAIHNRHSLVRPPGGLPAQYEVDVEGQGQLACLDCNHSHFILVDNGTHGSYGAEISLRTQLERFISQKTTSQDGPGMSIRIPTVCVVLEGGLGTLNTIHSAVSRGTPCVVVAGSGRVADVLAQVAGLPVGAITVALVQQKLAALFPETCEFTELCVLQWAKKIQDIVRSRQLLTIFREGRAGQQDVDVAILQALLKASCSHGHGGHKNWERQLQLAVAWNRVDLARSEIFTEERQWKPKELHSLTLEALRTNKPDFVRLFMESGVRLQDLATPDALQDLYSHLETKLHRGPFVDPMHDLLIWAIVQNHRELAEIIWAQSRDSIAAGLACSRMLRELAREGLDAKRLDATRALANEFESKAIGVFTECCREDREQAEKLLTRVSEAWGGSTCLQLALDAGAMQFMAQGGVQAYLTKVWWGELQEDTGLWRVALCLLTFPLLCTSLVTFRDSKLRSASSLRRARAFFNAPVVTFLLNILSYFAFLCLFAYVLMVDFQPTPSWSERFIYLWVFSLVCEELRQLFYSPDGSGLAKRASVYFGDFWNKLDVTAILLFVAGLACRLLPALLYSGRVLLALDFILLCLRLLHIFTVSRMLGPKIIILKRMMKDIFFFLLLLAVWVVSFGVAKQAILIHNESRTDWLFRGVLYHSYLTIFGQIPPYIDGVDFDPDHCSPDGSDPYKPKCPESDPSLGEPAFPQWLTVTLLCLHLLVTNILLLNLLIAMFNYTFQEVQECTDQVWKFQRLHLIQEYQARPPAPPPFILLGHLQLLFLRLVLKVPPQRHRQFNNKLVETEEAPLLSWEAYLKEHYLHGLQSQRQLSLEQRVRDIGDKVDDMMDLLEVERGRRWGSSEQRPASLEEQVARASGVLLRITQTLRSAGLVSEGDVPCLAPRKGPEEQEQEQDPALESRLLEEDPTDTHHISARQLLYPSSSVERFPVPNEKVPWEEEFLIYNPSFYTAEKSGPVDPDGSNRALLGQILYNAVDGAVDRRSFHGPYEVQDGLPRNPRGRTGLQGRGALSRFGPNHKLQPVVTRWRRNQDGVICRRNFRKVLEVLLLTSQQSEPWALPGGSQDPGEMLPQKFKAVIPGELHKAFGNLLDQGTQVYRGYVDHPRNTDNAWVEMVAVSIHFSSQNDETLWKLNQYLKGLSDPPGGKRNVEVCWQLVDKHIPLYPDHKAILRKVATHYEAHY